MKRARHKKGALAGFSQPACELPVDQPHRCSPGRQVEVVSASIQAPRFPPVPPNITKENSPGQKVRGEINKKGRMKVCLVLRLPLGKTQVGLSPAKHRHPSPAEALNYFWVPWKFPRRQKPNKNLVKPLGNPDNTACPKLVSMKLCVNPTQLTSRGSSTSC